MKIQLLCSGVFSLASHMLISCTAKESDNGICHLVRRLPFRDAGIVAEDAYIKGYILPTDPSRQCDRAGPLHLSRARLHQRRRVATRNNDAAHPTGRVFADGMAAGVSQRLWHVPYLLVPRRRYFTRLGSQRPSASHAIQPLLVPLLVREGRRRWRGVSTRTKYGSMPALL